MRLFFIFAIFLLSLSAYGQDVLVDQKFSAMSPAGWSSTSSTWIFNYNGTATTNYVSASWAARFPSASTGNSVYLYIPVTFQSGKIYTMSFYTKRACQITISANETANQTTLLDTETSINSGCSSNFSLWYQWTISLMPQYTGPGYLMLKVDVVYGGPTSVYLDDMMVLEADPVSLPIELLSFVAKKDGTDIRLDWSTASELNNDYFTVFRSLDGISEEQVAKMPGAGNSQHQLFYSAKDHSPYVGVSYYKLRQTDFDGKLKDTDWISVVFESDVDGLEVWPNPIGDEMVVSFMSSHRSPESISIFDAQGRKVFETSVMADAGSNVIRMEAPAMQKGIYFLKVGTDWKRIEI